MSASALQKRLAVPGGIGKQPAPGRKLLLVTVGLLGMILGAVAATGCNHAPAQAPPKAVEVIVTQPITDDVTDYQDFTGRLSAQYAVDVRARVTGYLLTANFKEGAYVKKNDVLFEIDASTFSAQLAQAEANIAQYEARVKRLETDLKRFTSTLTKGASTQQEVDTTTGDLGEARASLKACIAARNLASVNLGYCKVYSPIDGRISRRYVDPGNLINENNTLLTSVMSESPMYAYFDVDERTYLDLLQAAGEKASMWVTDLQFPVLMRLANEDEYSRAGKVNFVDNQVVANTGTIRMRGVFDNQQGTLKPGLFVRIRLPIGNPYKALLIADEALQSDQGRKYVYVVGANSEVIYRPVELGQEIHGLRVIKKGLADGDRVIVSGMQRVRPGAQVQVKMQGPPKKPESPLGRLLTLKRLFPDKPTGKEPVSEAVQSGR
jgi:RND family efflux transporter MFP subunit